MSWKVVIAHAPGEEALAERLAIPLQRAGYEVAHRGTVLVGRSFTEEAGIALSAGGPVVLCATVEALGTGWAHLLVNAAQGKISRRRVFIVRMEERVYIEQIAADTAIAEYWQDPAKGTEQLLQALQASFPLPQPKSSSNDTQLLSTAFLDQSTGTSDFNPEVLKDFREELREDVKARFPPDLDSWEFLRRSDLVRDGYLTRTGILLFGETPTNSIPTAKASFYIYEGTTKGAERKPEELRGTVLDQITGLHRQISNRIDSRERLRQDSPRSETVFQYPMRTVREIIANALVHRDYEDSKRVVHVRLFADHIEVLSPGTWVAKNLPTDGSPISLQELVSESVKRNITLATLVSWVRLVEGEGSGIVTALEECQEVSAPIPTVENIDGFVRVKIFPRADWKTVGTAKATDFSRGVLAKTLKPLYQLPSPPADFTGREEDLKAVRAAISQGGTGAMLGLRGMGGVGKTALALKIAEELAPLYPDAQLYLDLKGVDPQPLTVAQAMAHVIRSFHPEARVPESEADMAGLYRSVLHGKRALLLMDNAASRQQVEPLIPPAGSLMLATSRFLFTLPGLFARDLDELPSEDARALLLKIAPRIGKEAEAITRLCGRLPLALRLAGSALADRPDLSPSEYARRLREGKERFGEVEATLTVSYELLSEDRRRLWRLLAVFPGTFDARAAAAVWELGTDSASDALGNLVRSSLVEWDEKEERYRLHNLARGLADRELEEAELDAARRRHAEYFLDLLWAADRLYKQGGDDLVRALRLFDAEWGNVQAGFTWASDRLLEDETAARICDGYPNAGTYLLELRQHPRERIRWRETALATARRRKDRRREGVHLGNLGLAYAALGETRRAIELYEQHLAIARESADRREEGDALGNLGLAYAALADPRRAIEYYEQYLAIAREIGDRRAEGDAFSSLGLAYSALSEPRRAIVQNEQALAIAREIGDRRGEGNALGNLGLAYAALGEPRRAIEFTEQWLAIAREIGDRRSEANASWNLGLEIEKEGDLVRAAGLMQVCVDYEREIGHPDAEKHAAYVAALRARIAEQGS